jgi:hypothetical protein
MNLDLLITWFMSLDDRYGVDPAVFAVIYLGATPFFFASLAWVARNYRSRKSLALPTAFAALFFMSSYLYVAVAGDNLPGWLYAVGGALLCSGAYQVFRKVQSAMVAVPEGAVSADKGRASDLLW